MTDPVDMNRARELPAALLKLFAAMAAGDSARRKAALDVIADIRSS